MAGAIWNYAKMGRGGIWRDQESGAIGYRREGEIGGCRGKFQEQKKWQIRLEQAHQ